MGNLRRSTSSSSNRNFRFYLTFLLFRVMVARKNVGGLFNPLFVFAVILGRIAVFRWKLLPIGSLELASEGRLHWLVTTLGDFVVCID